MRFKEWLDELDKVKKEIAGIPLVDISEVLSVGGRHFVICMGKSGESVKDGDQEIDPKYMRTFFTHNKDEFYNFLENLQERVKEQRDAALSIANALAEEALPGAVIARMRGENVSGDSFDLLRRATIKALDQIGEFIQDMKPGLVSEISFALPDVAERPLSLHLDDSLIQVSWGTLEVQTPIAKIGSKSFSHSEGPLEEDMYFLANQKLIWSKLREIVRRVEALSASI